MSNQPNQDLQTILFVLSETFEDRPLVHRKDIKEALAIAFDCGLPSAEAIVSKEILKGSLSHEYGGYFALDGWKVI
tara:strand:+ start:484 stop:711 length:228 start_codon:yes stop_codon:yes gene_type:complete